MEKIALITDSCADIPAQYRDKYDIHVVPLIIQTKDGEFKDTVNIPAVRALHAIPICKKP